MRKLGAPPSIALTGTRTLLRPTGSKLGELAEPLIFSVFKGIRGVPKGGV